MRVPKRHVFVRHGIVFSDCSAIVWILELDGCWQRTMHLLSMKLKCQQYLLYGSFRQRRYRNIPWSEVRVWQLLRTKVRVPLFQSDFDAIGFGILDDEIVDVIFDVLGVASACCLVSVAFSISKYTSFNQIDAFVILLSVSTSWLAAMTILLSGDVEMNPGPDEIGFACKVGQALLTRSHDFSSVLDRAKWSKVMSFYSRIEPLEKKNPEDLTRCLPIEEGVIELCLKNSQLLPRQLNWKKSDNVRRCTFLLFCVLKAMKDERAKKGEVMNAYSDRLLKKYATEQIRSIECSIWG